MINQVEITNKIAERIELTYEVLIKLKLVLNGQENASSLNQYVD